MALLKTASTIYSFCLTELSSLTKSAHDRLRTSGDNQSRLHRLYVIPVCHQPTRRKLCVFCGQETDWY